MCHSISAGKLLWAGDTVNTCNKQEPQAATLYLLILCLISMHKHMSLFHFLSHLCKWPELDLPHDTLSYTAQDTLLPRWHLSPNLFTLLALSSAANYLLWDYIVSTEVTHFHCIKQDTNYRWLILLFRYELVNSFNWHIFEVQLKRRKNPDFMLRPFHTMW